MSTTVPCLEAIPIVDSRNALGESVLWSAALQSAYWIDGVVAEIHRWEALSSRYSVTKLPLDPVIGMIAATSEGNTFALSYAGGLALVNVDTLKLTRVADPERSRADIGYNDGKVDLRGRLWAGTFDVTETEPRGCLWVLEHGATPQLMESGLAVVNGPAFSPDGSTVYVSDSIGRRILAYELEGTRLRNRRVLAGFAKEEGLPDGLTVDAEGCIWCAHWDGARVTRLSPKGERMLTVAIPAPRVTSVAFGGASLDMLFVTTARYGLSETALATYPDSGALFGIQTGVRGLKAIPLPLPFSPREAL
jgi:sugar lactone lactonase YvrE